MEEKPKVSVPEKDNKKKGSQDQTRREFIKKMAYMAPVVTTLLITHDLSMPDSSQAQQVVCIGQCACRRQSPCRTAQPCKRQCCVQAIQPCRREPCQIQPVCIRIC